MTSDRRKVGISIKKGTDKITIKEKNGVSKDYTFLKEIELKDDDGNIIGVFTEWQ